MTSTWWKHYAAQVPLSASKTCQFFGSVFLQYASWKNCTLGGPFQSLPNKKYLCRDSKNLSQLCQKVSNTQKTFQVPAIFRENVIQIFVMVNFYEANCTAAVQSQKVWYVENCLGREPKEIASIPARTSSSLFQKKLLAGLYL